MNYFELFGIKPSFHPDPAFVKQRFYELSRQYHPDHFAAGDSDKMVETLKMAAEINQAYKALKDPDATMAYVLRTHGMLEDEEKYALPPAFLMEMMELNEAVSDYEASPQDEPARLAAKNALAEHIENWRDAIEPLTTRYDAGNHDDKLLMAIKDMYFRRKYLIRIEERMGHIS